MKFLNTVLLLLGLLILTACDQRVEQSSKDEKLKVVATTTIVGDIVSQVGGDHIDLSILLPVGTDPHSFDPSPQDIAKVAEADLVFANGVGLEDFLDPLIESAGAQNKVVYVSEGIDLLTLTDDEPGHTGNDPHTWTDPNNIKFWIDNIVRTLSELDPENEDAHMANAEAYKTELYELDAWIRSQVGLIPSENRKLVTDHALFGYFANEYGFDQVGALIPGYSTLAEPTANELAAIEDAIRVLDVRAIFVGNTINPNLAERVAEDTGTQLIFIYTGSLSEPDSDAPTYIDYMRYNSNAFVNALK